MKKALFSLFLTLASTTFAWSLKTGTYELKGTNPQGGSYRGEVVIAPQGKNYSVIWYIGNKQVQAGVGIHNEWEDLFSVAYADQSQRSWGVVSYKVGAWGDLDGTWTAYQGTTQGTEKLTWSSSSTY